MRFETNVKPIYRAFLEKSIYRDNVGDIVEIGRYCLEVWILLSSIHFKAQAALVWSLSLYPGLTYITFIPFNPRKIIGPEEFETELHDPQKSSK